jgi:hypothetical protein
VAFHTNSSELYSAVQLNVDEIVQFIKIPLCISKGNKRKSFQTFHEETNWTIDEYNETETKCDQKK